MPEHGKTPRTLTVAVMVPNRVGPPNVLETVMEDIDADAVHDPPEPSQEDDCTVPSLFRMTTALAPVAPEKQAAPLGALPPL